LKVTSIDQVRFEPTVFGAVRRYRIMVLTIALMTTAAAVGYTLVVPELYRAEATVTVPQTSLAQGDAREQYLDSQVLILQSQQVADRAVRIANGALKGNVLSARDFAGEGRSLVITPPVQATPGSYGSSIVAVSFTWPSARIAQVGANAVLQAFDDVRAAAITAEGEATVAGIEKAIRDARTRGQITDLMNQRTQALTSQQVDLARHPTVVWAVEPQIAINANPKRSGAIGLLIGIVLGAAVAYARASRRRRFEDRLDPAAIYDAPLIGEIPARVAGRIRSNRTAVARSLPMAADPHSAVAEAFRFTAGSIERICAAHGARLALAFVSTNARAGRSSVVANVALAVAKGGTTVLAVDASTDGGLTALLLPGSPEGDGFDQVLGGERSVSDCIHTSPLHQGLTVLRAGHAPTERTTGAAYSKAVEKMIVEAKSSFDLVLIDSPALLRVADATELVEQSDAAIIVLGSGEPVRDHITMVERLNLSESDVIGYIYQRARKGHRFAPRLRGRTSALSARRTGLPATPRSQVFRRRRRRRKTSPVPVSRARG
jgi:Mrp family chromosome partitioning ATPase